MPHLEESVALATCERALRQLLVFELQRKYGDGWLNKVSSEEQRAKWASARENDRSGRTKRGAVDVPGGPLDYAEFWQVVAIASDVWDQLLKPSLGKKADMLPFLKRVADLRNPVGHSRELLPFEQDLISGIAGDIRNRVTIYMSGTDPQGDYYPRIQTVTDSFGNVVTQESDLGQSIKTGLTLNFGDTVTYQCRGTDPHGRELSWRFLGLQTDGKSDSTVGDDVELSLTFDVPRLTGKEVTVTIGMASSSSYHLSGNFDGMVAFSYRVLPPDPRRADAGTGQPPE